MTTFKPSLILCERLEKASQEERVIHTAALLSDISLQWLTAPELFEHTQALISGSALAVGSVNFIRTALHCVGVKEPENFSYPALLKDYFHRRITLRTVKDVQGVHFVKPFTTKLFTGCIFDTLGAPEALCAHDKLQYEAFRALPRDTPVWVSEVVQWQNEARYYVLNGELLGIGFYGEYPDEAPTPDLKAVQEMTSKLSAARTMPCAFALDVGVLKSGETALVECNDAWAIGYYKGTLSASQYLKFLWARWTQLLMKCVSAAPFITTDNTSDGQSQTRSP